MAPSTRATAGEQDEQLGDRCLRAHGFDLVQLWLLLSDAGTGAPMERVPIGPRSAHLSRETCLPLGVESVLGPLCGRGPLVIAATSSPGVSSIRAGCVAVLAYLLLMGLSGCGANVTFKPGV